MRILRETGFFNKETIKVGEAEISPIELTSKLLFPRWKLEEGEEDITIMKVIVTGTRNSQATRYTWDLFDTYDPSTKVHSMARTTGYTATMALRMLAAGLYTTKGVSAPEYIGKHTECVNFILDGLKQRGVIYREKIDKL
jgi:saccharopine dehydrogenase-like NADP-dependent oxidoreductase